MLTTAGVIAADFNPHPHTEGDFAWSIRENHHRDFNPHPHTEGDTLKNKKITSI